MRKAVAVALFLYLLTVAPIVEKVDPGVVCRHVYFRPGRYDARLERCKLKLPRNSPLFDCSTSSEKRGGYGKGAMSAPRPCQPASFL
jgi:hypothetical protein